MPTSATGRQDGAGFTESLEDNPDKQDNMGPLRGWFAVWYKDLLIFRFQNRADPMPLKKKISVTKNPEKRTPPLQVSPRKDGKNGQAPPPAAKVAPKAGAPIVQPASARTQLQAFEAAMRLFHSRKFREAQVLFQEAQAGPDRGVAHRAELQVRMCQRRLEEQRVTLSTAEDHYNYAVTLINSRDLGAAQQHLQAALAQEPSADHVYYALALCYGLAGNLQAAYENLKRAIDLRPQNRITARQDADFAGIANQPPLDRLLFPEKKSYL